MNDQSYDRTILGDWLRAAQYFAGHAHEKGAFLTFVERTAAAHKHFTRSTQSTSHHGDILQGYMIVAKGIADEQKLEGTGHRDFVEKALLRSADMHLSTVTRMWHARQNLYHRAIDAKAMISSGVIETPLTRDIADVLEGAIESGIKKARAAHGLGL